jgi:acyl-coenzyme A synthetase/AMP-(fatty) acid ligase
MARPVTQDSDSDQYWSLNDRLARLERVVSDSGVPAQATGTGALTFTSGSSAGPTTITHGLAVVPSSVICTATFTPDTREDYIITTANWTDTTFDVRGRAGAGETFPMVVGTVIGFSWAAFV